jgi:hypothetical protein
LVENKLKILILNIVNFILNTSFTLMKKIFIPAISFGALFIAILLLAYKVPPGMMHSRRSVNDTITDAMKRIPSNALQGLDVAYGLEVQLIAAEPMLQNPTNIDVDDRGRIWVTEAYNYRPAINGNPTRAAGDRIVILEDLNEDVIWENSSDGENQFDSNELIDLSKKIFLHLTL